MDFRFGNTLKKTFTFEMKKNKEKNEVQRQQQSSLTSFVKVPSLLRTTTTSVSNDHLHRHTYPTKQTQIDESCLLLFSKNKQSRLEVLSFLDRFKRTGHDEFRQECSTSNGMGRSGIVFPFKIINYPIFLEFYQTHTELVFSQKTLLHGASSFKQKIKNRYSHHSEKIHISGKCIGMSLTDQESNQKICSLDQPIVTAPDFQSKIQELKTAYLKTEADTPEARFNHKMIKLWETTADRFGIEIETGIQAIHPKEASQIFFLAYKTQPMTNQYGTTNRLTTKFFPICLAHAYLLFHMPDDHPSTFIPPICDVYEDWLKRPNKDNHSLYYETVLRNSGALYIHYSTDSDNKKFNSNSIKKKKKQFMHRFFSGGGGKGISNDGDASAEQTLLDYDAEDEFHPASSNSTSVYPNQSYFAEAMHFFHHIMSPFNCCSNAVHYNASRSLTDEDDDDTSMQSIYQRGGIVNEFLEKRINKTAGYHQVSTTDHAYYDEKDDDNDNNNSLTKETTENPFESDFDSKEQ